MRESSWGQGRTVLYCSPEELERFSLESGEKTRVRCGTAVVTATVQEAKDIDGTRFSPMLRARLRIPGGFRGKVIYNADKQEAHIGPLIGLLTAPLGSKRDPGNTALFRGLSRAGRTIGAAVYAFTSHDVDWSRRLVRGTFVRGGQLVQMMVPLPDVIYNRVPNRALERTPHYRNFLRQLKRATHVYMFNPRFFNKWQVHRWLASVPEAARYLPDTRPFRGVRDVEAVLKKHRYAYVKPVGGSLGKGIIRVRTGAGGIAVSYRVGSRNISHQHISWPAAAAEIFTVRHRRSYLVQQGLPLAKYKGRSFDVRVTMHRDGTGQWVPVGPAAKIAASGAITTHVHSGGRVLPLKRVLATVFPGKDREVHQRVMDAGRIIAESVEKASGMKLGELGLDLGITPQGEVYHFESNAKPGRMIFYPSWARRDRLYSLRCVCAYAHFVTGFGSIEGR